jgi:hypothetical protein
MRLTLMAGLTLVGLAAVPCHVVAQAPGSWR